MDWEILDADEAFRTVTYAEAISYAEQHAWEARRLANEFAASMKASGGGFMSTPPALTLGQLHAQISLAWVGIAQQIG